MKTRFREGDVAVKRIGTVFFFKKKEIQNSSKNCLQNQSLSITNISTIFAIFSPKHYCCSISLLIQTYTHSTFRFNGLLNNFVRKNRLLLHLAFVFDQHFAVLKTHNDYILSVSSNNTLFQLLWLIVHTEVWVLHCHHKKLIVIFFRFHSFLNYQIILATNYTTVA